MVSIGFTLPSNIGELRDDITELDLSSCSLTGRFITRMLSGLPARLVFAKSSVLGFVKTDTSAAIVPPNSSHFEIREGREQLQCLGKRMS